MYIIVAPRTTPHRLNQLPGGDHHKSEIIGNKPAFTTPSFSANPQDSNVVPKQSTVAQLLIDCMDCRFKTVTACDLGTHLPARSRTARHRSISTSSKVSAEVPVRSQCSTSPSAASYPASSALHARADRFFTHFLHWHNVGDGGDVSYDACTCISNKQLVQE